MQLFVVNCRFTYLMEQVNEVYEERPYLREVSPIEVNYFTTLPPCAYEMLAVVQRHLCPLMHEQRQVYIPYWAFLCKTLEQVFIYLAVIAEEHSVPPSHP